MQNSSLVSFLNAQKAQCSFLDLFLHCRLGLAFFVTISVLLTPITNAEVVINEIMYHPPADGGDAEYIELYNTAKDQVDISNWSFQDGIDFQFPQGTFIEGEGYLVVCRNEIFVRQSYGLGEFLPTVGNYAPSQLSNGGERIVLTDVEGNEVDRVSYNDNPPWPRNADGEGASLELVHPLSDNNNVLYWRASQIPTPGAYNSRAVDRIPPRIDTVRQIPQSPTDEDDVRIEIRFDRDDSIQNVTLTFMIDGGSPQSVRMTQEGDRFEAVLPPRSSGTVVEYWITAVNTDGYSIIAPAGSTDRLYTYVVENQPVEAGAVVINDIMYNNPASFDEDKEWIELYNPNTAAVDLSYWVVKDSEDVHSFRLPKGTIIEGEGYLLVARERESDWTAPAIVGLSFSLDDGGDSVRLMDPNGRLIASVEYNDNGEWPEGADGDGGSLELLQVTRPNGDPNNWGLSPWGGTPGRYNARVIADPNYHDFDVVINEIYYHPVDEEYGGNLETEYVELFNRSSQAIDLSGWYFSQGIDFSFPTGTILVGKGYLLVCRDIERYPDVKNKTGNYVLQLSNGGEALALTNDQSIVIDYVRYRDEPPWPVLPDGEGSSLELIHSHADNRLPSSWRSGQPSSPGLANSRLVSNPPPRISEVSHSPKLPTAQASEEQVDTQMLVSVGDQWKFFRGRTAPPSNWNDPDFQATDWEEGPSGIGYGDNDDATVLDDMRYNYLSVYLRKEFTLEDVGDYSQFWLRIDYDDSFIAYLNGEEIARSSNISGNPTYETSANANHEAGAPESFDVSRYIPLLRSGTNVLAIEGHNVSMTSSDFSLIPQLELVRVIPASEEDSDTIVISVRVDDIDGISEVKLHYQHLVSPIGVGLVLDDWRSLPMFDDGSHGDRRAGDGVYTFTLNDAVSVKPNELWRYKISAKDGKGNEAILPLQDDLTRNFIFYVADRLKSPKYPTIRIFMERSVLSWLNRNVQSDEEQPCIVVIGREAFDLYNAGGVRYRGHVLRNKPKKSWKVRFPKGNRWQEKRALNLNANYQTSPLVRGEAGFMEHLAYGFFREAGVPAANTGHWRVELNNDYYGLFIMAEQYNEDFIDQHGLPEETRIFKAGVKARRSYLTPEPNFETYALKYEYMMGREDDIQDLIDFIERLNDSSTDLKTFFETHLEIDTYLDYLACVAVLSHVDSTEKNYFPTKGANSRWFIMPWDISHAWGEIHTNNSFPFLSDYSLLDGAQGGVFGVNRLRQKFLSVPEFRQRYFQRLRDFTDHNFTREHLDPVFDEYWDYLKDAIDENVERWNSPGQISQMVPQMKQYVSSRIAFIRNNSQVRPGGIPTQPVNSAPEEGSLLASRSVRLTAEFPDEGIVASEWEIQSKSDNFFHPHWKRTVELSSPVSIDVPPGVLAAGANYYWRVRIQNEEGLWSDWSASTSFTTRELLLPPDVQNVVVTPFDQSVRLEWDRPVAEDLIRVDIFLGTSIVESTPIHDSRVRIRDLENGRTYPFTIRTVSRDRQVSPGVTVTATPVGPPPVGTTVAYFRFEGNVTDSAGYFGEGQLLGTASISAPGAENPVPLNQLQNLNSLNLNGVPGNGFRFGSDEAALDVREQLTIECYAQLSTSAQGPMVLVDRYDEENASRDGIWRFGVNYSMAGSLDFFFNDGDSTSGFGGRLHITTGKPVVPFDGEFHHFAAVLNLDAASVRDKVKLFVDGVPTLSTTVFHEDEESDYDSFRIGSDFPVYVGAKRMSGATAEVLQGRIDEVRLTVGNLDRQAFLHPSSEQPAVKDWSLF